MTLNASGRYWHNKMQLEAINSNAANLNAWSHPSKNVKTA